MRFIFLEKGTCFTDLRRQARHIENELDLKLVSFCKLGTTFGHQNTAVGDGTPLLSSSSSEHMIETMAMEIEQLLAKVCLLRW